MLWDWLYLFWKYDVYGQTELEYSSQLNLQEPNKDIETSIVVNHIKSRWR